MCKSRPTYFYICANNYVICVYASPIRTFQNVFISVQATCLLLRALFPTGGRLLVIAILMCENKNLSTSAGFAPRSPPQTPPLDPTGDFRPPDPSANPSPSNATTFYRSRRPATYSAKDTRVCNLCGDLGSWKKKRENSDRNQSFGFQVHRKC